MVFIDGKREFFKNITKELSDHRAYLSAEVVRAYRWGFIDKAAALPLIERLLVQDADWEAVEKEMFEAASDTALLKKYLMGFRPANTPIKPLS